MTKRNIKIGFEFSLNGEDVYKVTAVEGSTFYAIWIGDYSDRDMTTYWGFTRHGDFSLDQVKFEIKDGKIERVLFFLPPSWKRIAKDFVREKVIECGKYGGCTELGHDWRCPVQRFKK